MTKKENIECPVCEGWGDIEVGCRCGDPFDPISKTCPLCHGTGEVSQQTAESFDPENPDFGPQSREDWI